MSMTCEQGNSLLEQLKESGLPITQFLDQEQKKRVLIETQKREGLLELINPNQGVAQKTNHPTS